MDKIKKFLKLTKYHFLRLPIIRSIVRWMYKFYINQKSQEIHVIKEKTIKPVCGLDIEEKKFKKNDYYR